MSIGKKYKMYVFDFDGTLVDTQEDIGRSINILMDELGLPQTDLATLHSAITGGAKSAVQKLTGIDDSEITPHVERFFSIYFDICADNATIYEGGIPLLNRLKSAGAKLAVVTMKARIPTKKIIKAHRLDHFDDVVSFDDMEKRKPNPDSMNKLLKKHKLNPGDVLMIGDTVSDMKYAKAAGVDVAAVTYGYGVTNEVLAENPDYVLDSLSEL